MCDDAPSVSSGLPAAQPRLSRLPDVPEKPKVAARYVRAAARQQLSPIRESNKACSVNEVDCRATAWERCLRKRTSKESAGQTSAAIAERTQTNPNGNCSADKRCGGL